MRVINPIAVKLSPEMKNLLVINGYIRDFGLSLALLVVKGLDERITLRNINELMIDNSIPMALQVWPILIIILSQTLISYTCKILKMIKIILYKFSML